MAKNDNRWHFIVKGKGHFPLDMLRYDSCWPRDQDAVYAMLEHQTERRIELTSVREPTEGRWNSFDWSVVYIKSYQV